MDRKVGVKMKIYINSNYEIKAINSTTDESLTEIENLNNNKTLLLNSEENNFDNIKEAIIESIPKLTLKSIEKII